MDYLRAHWPLLVRDRRIRWLILGIAHCGGPRRGRFLMEMVMDRRISIRMQRKLIFLGIRVEVDVGSRTRMRVAVHRQNRRRLETLALPLRRQRQTRAGRSRQVLDPFKKPMQRFAEGAQGSRVPSVGIGEGVAAAYGLGEQPGPLVAERHRLEIVDLRASTAHGSKIEERVKLSSSSE